LVEERNLQIVAEEFPIVVPLFIQTIAPIPRPIQPTTISSYSHEYLTLAEKIMNILKNVAFSPSN
jgi:hemoglobin-like flavoprotein